MTMTLAPIQQLTILAQAEATAAKAKGKADLAWREMWWKVTKALGAIPASSKKEIGEAQTIVREATGQSATYVQERTRVGRSFTMLEHGENTIPPRMAIEVVRQKITPTPAIIKLMLEIDADPNRGLRDFFTELTGKSWADKPEGMSTETIEKIIAAQPEVVAKAVANNTTASSTVLEAFTPGQWATHATTVSDKAFTAMNDGIVAATTPVEAVITSKGVTPASKPIFQPSPAKLKSVQTTAKAVQTAAAKKHWDDMIAAAKVKQAQNDAEAVAQGINPDDPDLHLDLATMGTGPDHAGEMASMGIELLIGNVEEAIEKATMAISAKHNWSDLDRKMFAEFGAGIRKALDIYDFQVGLISL